MELTEFEKFQFGYVRLPNQCNNNPTDCVRLIFGSVWKGDERVYQQQGFVLAPNF